MSRIYWDTMLFIYWLEDDVQYATRVNEIYSRMKARGDSLLTGSFAFGEVLAGIHRKGAGSRAGEVRRQLEQVVSEIVDFTIEVADRYGHIRGSLGVSPADAIHLALAAQAGADLFLTNDKTLVGKIVPGIQFIASMEADIL